MPDPLAWPRSEPVTVTAGTLHDWSLPDPAGDKESRGRVFVVGGGTQTPGAVLLAGEAALRAGAGRLQLAVASPAAPGLALTMPECRGPSGSPPTTQGSWEEPLLPRCARRREVPTWCSSGRA